LPKVHTEGEQLRVRDFWASLELDFSHVLVKKL